MLRYYVEANDNFGVNNKNTSLIKCQFAMGITENIFLI